MNDLAWCREQTRDMTGLLTQLVAIESPSTDPGGVAELARHLARELEPLAAGHARRAAAAGRRRPALRPGGLRHEGGAVLGFEPAWPGGAVKTERKGSGSFALRARGRAAHAGADLTRGPTRSSFAAALGVPTVDGLGADGDGAHAADEHVLIPSLPDRARSPPG